MSVLLSRAAISAIALCLLVAGCGSPGAPIPGGGQAGDAGPTARSKAAVPHGVYVAWIKNYDGHLRAAVMSVQIGPAATCPGFASILPAAVAKGEKSPFEDAFYASAMTLSRFAVDGERVRVVGNAKLASDLGTLHVAGILENKTLNVRYHDRRGNGRVTLRYAGRCRASLAGTLPPPPATAFIGHWTVVLGAPAPGYDPQTVDMQIADASVANGAIRFDGFVNTTLAYGIPNGPPYSFEGTWTSGVWGITVSCGGACGPAYTWGTQNWYPPSADATDGYWVDLSDTDYAAESVSISQ